MTDQPTTPPIKMALRLLAILDELVPSLSSRHASAVLAATCELSAKLATYTLARAELERLGSSAPDEVKVAAGFTATDDMPPDMAAADPEAAAISPAAAMTPAAALGDAHYKPRSVPLSGPGSLTEEQMLAELERHLRAGTTVEISTSDEADDESPGRAVGIVIRIKQTDKEPTIHSGQDLPMALQLALADLKMPGAVVQ